MFNSVAPSALEASARSAVWAVAVVWEVADLVS